MKTKFNILIIVLMVLIIFVTIGCMRGGSKKEFEDGQKLQVLIDSSIVHDSEDPIHNIVLLVEGKKI